MYMYMYIAIYVYMFTYNIYIYIIYIHVYVYIHVYNYIIIYIYRGGTPKFGIDVEGVDYHTPICLDLETCPKKRCAKRCSEIDTEAF